MHASVDQSQAPRLWVSGLVFLVSLVLSLVAVFPLTLGAGGYLAADENAAFLTAGRVRFMLVLFAVALAPFLAAVVAFVSVLIVRRDVSMALLTASGWVAGLGVVAFLAAAVKSSGF